MNILRRIIDFLFPATCAYCSSPVGDSDVPFFCSTCWGDFSLINGPICPRCGRPYDSSETISQDQAHLCGQCRIYPPHYDQAISVGQFEGPLREAIHQFKYRPCRSIGKLLAEWMAGNISVKGDFDLVMPVPLHRRRVRQRGFNQALLLAYGVSSAFGISLCYDNIIRIRQTRPQVELSGKERIKNVAGAFALARPGEINKKRVLLVDDVFTTGATMDECSRVLKKAGASGVTALTAARAV